MTLCSNGFLCYGDCATNGALLTSGKTCFGTGCILSCYGFLGVTECCNGFLCYENFLTYGAVLTLGKTGSGTGGSLSRVNNLGVSLCSYVNERHIKKILICFSIYTRNKCLITVATGDLNITVFSTACAVYLKTTISMSCCSNGNVSSAHFCITYRAFYNTVVRACVCTAGSYLVFLNRSACSMRNGGNCFRCSNNFKTYRTVFSVGLSSGGTSCCIALLNCLGMTVGCDFSILLISAFANKMLATLFSTSRSFSDSFGIFVSLCRAILYKLAACTLEPVIVVIVYNNGIYVIDMTGCLVNNIFTNGTLNGIILGRRVSIGSMYCIRAVNAAVIGAYVPMSVSIRCPSRAILMVGYRNELLSLNYFITYGAMLTLGKSCGSTGRVYRCINNLGVSKLRNLGLRNGCLLTS